MDASEYNKMYHLEEANWWYAGRRDLVLNVAGRINKSISEKPLRILDAGCGTGMNLKCIQDMGEAYGLDISKNALRLSKSRGLSSLICGSADRLPFKSNLFDLILALDVIEHIEEDLLAIEELNRVLKPGGHLIITVPAFQFLWSEHDQAVHHRRRYAKSSIIRMLQSGGFENEKATYWNFFLFMPVAAMRIIKKFRRSNEKKQTDLAELPFCLNGLLKILLRIENRILGEFDLPVGVSVMCVCRKVREGQ